MYATADTANAIRSLGIQVHEVPDIVPGSEAYQLMEDGTIGLIIYTGALYDDTIQEYIELHREAVRHSIPSITALDTANAMANMIASRFHLFNTELVDLNNMRKERQLLPFAKMQGCGNDYIFFDNRDGKITSPGSLCVSLCDRHYGIGGYGIVLIEDSDIADAKMRIFNRDGTEGKMAGNSIRCVGKYLYDKGIVKKEYMTIETAVGVKSLLLYIRNGKANTISVGMGKADLDTKSLPTTLPGSTIINRPVDIADGTYNITCASVGNPTVWSSVTIPPPWTWRSSARSLSTPPTSLSGSTPSLSVSSTTTPCGCASTSAATARPWPAAPAPAPPSSPPPRTVTWKRARTSPSSWSAATWWSIIRTTKSS